LHIGTRLVRKLANIVYWIKLREERSTERVKRSFGVVTSQQVMTYLTDHRKTNNPMTRSQAHDLMGELATKAWESKTPFIDVLLQNEGVCSRSSEKVLRELTNPLKYSKKPALFSQYQQTPLLLAGVQLKQS